MRYSKCSFCATIHTGNDIPTNCVCCGAPLPMPEYTKNDDELKDFKQAAMEGAAEAVKKVMDKALLGGTKTVSESEAEKEQEEKEFEDKKLELEDLLDDIIFDINDDCDKALKPIIRETDEKYNTLTGIVTTIAIFSTVAATILACMRWELTGTLVTAGLIAVWAIIYFILSNKADDRLEPRRDELTEIAEGAFYKSLNGDRIRELYKEADDEYFNWKPEKNEEEWREICDRLRNAHNEELNDRVRVCVNHAICAPLDWQILAEELAFLPILAFICSASLGLVGLLFNANPTTTTEDSFTAINHLCSLQSSICLEDGEGNKLYLGLVETEKENPTAQAALEEIKKLSEDDTVTVETKTIKYGYKDRFMKSGEPSEWNKTHYYINGAEFEIYLNQTACKQLDSYSDEYVFADEAAAEATTEAITEVTT